MEGQLEGVCVCVCEKVGHWMYLKAAKCPRESQEGDQAKIALPSMSVLQKGSRQQTSNRRETPPGAARGPRIRDLPRHPVSDPADHQILGHSRPTPHGGLESTQPRPSPPFTPRYPTHAELLGTQGGQVTPSCEMHIQSLL